MRQFATCVGPSSLRQEKEKDSLARSNWSWRIECASQLSKILRQLDAKGIDWIAQFVDICEWFNTQTNLLKSLLTFLDQVYIVRTPHADRIRFNARIFGNPNIVNSLRAGIEGWVNWERSLRLEREEGDKILVLIKQRFVYNQYPFFEEHYIHLMRFFLEESETLAKTMKKDASGFFKHMRLRLEEEVRRAKQILPVSDWTLVKSATEEALWMGRVEWLANETVSIYMGRKDVDTLASMYALFSRVSGTNALCDSFKRYIQVYALVHYSLPTSSTAEPANRGRQRDPFNVAKEMGWNWRDPRVAFYRTETEDDIRNRWEESKGELTREWRRRWKEAGKLSRRKHGGVRVEGE